MFWRILKKDLKRKKTMNIILLLFVILCSMFAAAAMSLSSFCVVTNALRLNWVDIHDAARDKRVRPIEKMEKFEKENIQNKKEDLKMTKTMKIEGMMCGHCEARVKKCLEALAEVSEAVVNHEEGTAVVICTAEVADEVLTKAVEEQDYKVISVN